MRKPRTFELASSIALVTGASRGIGPVLAEALARRGCHLALAARDAAKLAEVAEQLRPLGVRVLTIPTDLNDRAQLHALLSRVQTELGEIDVLVNNAAQEQVWRLEQLTEADIDGYMALNLTAPMQLTRLILPSMLARGRGHVVNVSSTASFGAAAFGETYGASKAGLLGFTRSLRASLKTLDHPVSASVICPGFIADLGMYADMREASGVSAPALLGTCTSGEVATAMIQAIEHDEPELIVGRRMQRLVIAIGTLLPRLMERGTMLFGINHMFLRVLRSGEARAASHAQKPLP